MKLKDYVTLGNLLGGLAAIIALLENDFDWACYCIYIAYAFDVLDGPVARLTKQHDTFGAHLDTACDYVTNSIAAPFLLYHAFTVQAHWPVWLSAIIALCPAAFGTIRQARGYDKDTSFPCYWLGLPRPALALFFVAILNSSLWRATSGTGAQVVHVITAILVVTLSCLHLSNIPFNSNKYRRWLGMMWIGRLYFLVGSPLSLIVGWLFFGYPGLFFDHLVAALFIYIFLAWTQIPKGDWRRVRHYIKTGEKVQPMIHVNSTWVPVHILPALHAQSDDGLPTQAENANSPATKTA